MKDGLKSLQDQLKKTTDPTEYNKLTKAIIDQKNQLQQAQAATNGFANSTFGVSRAARVAHNDLDQTVRSLEGFSRGSSGAADGVSNLIFTFERLKGVTGSTSSALGAIGEALLSPAGLVLALGAGIPLIIEAADKFESMSDGSRQAKEEIDALTDSLKRNKAQLEGFNDEIDHANVVRKLKIDLITGPGTERTLAELNSDFDAAKTKIANVVPALKEWGEELDKLKGKNAAIQKEADKAGVSLSKEGQVLFDANSKKIEVLTKQIDDFKKQETNANNAIEEIPLRIKIVEADKAREDAKKAAEDAAKAAKIAAANVVKDIKVTDGLIVLTNLRIVPQNVDIDVNAKGASDALTGALNKSIKTPEEIAKSFKALNEEMAKAGNFGELLQAKVNMGAFETEVGKAIGVFGGIKKEVATTASLIDEAVTPAFQNMFAEISHGGNALKAFFKGIEQSIVQLISKLVIAAAEAAILSIFTGGSTTFLSAFKSLALPHFAEGGIVNGATHAIVGEAGPEVIMPLDKLKGLIGGLALAGGNQNVVVSGRISGNDILLSNQRTSKTNNRSF